jgi:hypothetical protein
MEKSAVLEIPSTLLNLVTCTARNKSILTLTAPRLFGDAHSVVLRRTCRHFSPLISLHPLDLISRTGTPHLWNAARKTLDWKLQHSGGHTGWSAAWAASMFARLQDGVGMQAMMDKSASPKSL